MGDVRSLECLNKLMVVRHLKVMYNSTPTVDLLAFPLDLRMVVSACVLGVACPEVFSKFSSHGLATCGNYTKDFLYFTLIPFFWC